LIVGFERRPNTSRLHRLVEELGEIGLILDGLEGWHELAVTEIDYAMRPDVHERRVPGVGALIEPMTDPDTWQAATALAIDRRATAEQGLDSARHYADGVTSWLIRRMDGHDEWIVFDRPAGSERDLVILADAFGAVVVQRHPSSVVRVVGTFGASAPTVDCLGGRPRDAIFWGRCGAGIRSARWSACVGHSRWRWPLESVARQAGAGGVDVVEITLDGTVQNPPSLPTEPNCSSRCGAVATTSVPPIWSSSRSTDPSHGN
jgi:hypothetical protein